MSVPWDYVQAVGRGSRPLHRWTKTTPCRVQDEADCNLWVRIEFVRCVLLSVCEAVQPRHLIWVFFCVRVYPLWSYATRRLLTHASPLYEGTTGAAVRGFFLQARTVTSASAEHLHGWPGREHRLGSTTPCKPRSVPERLHKCRTSWVVSGSA